MQNNHTNAYRSTAIRIAAIVVYCLCYQSTFAQDSHTRGIRYYGTAGLRKVGPESQSKLESVDIVYGTTLTEDDVSFLSTCTNVIELSIGGNLSDEFVTLEGSLSKLAGMKGLRRVFLCKEKMQDEDLEFIAKLPKLEYLEFLADTNANGEAGPIVTDRCADFLRHATTLQDLCIDGGNFTDQFISTLSQDLRNLEHLRLGSNELTDNSLDMLASRCVKLKWLDLYSNRFTDRGVQHLAKARNLEMLWLNSDALTGACVDWVAGLIRLKHLELTVPCIENEGVQTLASLPCLEILALRQPALTDEQFALFGNHPTLESAFLNGSELSETKLLEVIETIPNLRQLSIGPKNKALQWAIDRLLKRREANRSRKQPKDPG